MRYDELASAIELSYSSARCNYTPVNGTYIINNRTCAVHDNGTMYPIPGEGFITLNREEYELFRVYRTFGDSERAAGIIENILHSKGCKITTQNIENVLGAYRIMSAS